MDQHNQQCDNINQEDQAKFLVGIIGFNASDEDSFNRFFQVNRVGQRKYTSADKSDSTRCQILIVNYDDASAVNESNRIVTTCPKIRVVAVSRGPLEPPPPYHIRGMLFAARVLTTLDKVAFEEPSTNPVVAEAIKTEIPAIAQIKDSSIINQPPITKPLEIPKASNLGGYRALVVDDSIAIQKSIELNLAILPQINVIDFADSGEMAIEKADTSQYDLIFLDVMMPGIDGYETCTRLRKKPEYKRTPIIMVSGKTSPLDEVKGVMAGCTTYLTKPVQKEAFQKLSIRVLGWLEKQKTI